MSEREGPAAGDGAGRSDESGGHDAARLHSSVRSLFHELYELTPDQRLARLEELGTPTPVRDELAELFANLEREDALEESRLGELGERLLRSGGQSDALGLPERIGDYVVLERLGEGGMGVVYAARRDGDERRVAIKVMQPGADAGRLTNRFRREIEVLEQLRHPGIAAFHEAGETVVESATGKVQLPFLVMELVEGAALLDHVERHGLSDRDRVALAAKICAALEHAHEHGVVHRDLKPGNILVEVRGDDPVGQPKVLDFGVALSRSTDLATLTATRTGVLLGTLPYMSPEQVDGRGRTLDRRSDVYSLGVVMFELLTGALPYDVRDRPLIEAARVIAEVEPTRLGSIAPRLGGALEAVLGKALEKNPAHRYPSAAALAEDLERYLRGDSVLARRPSLGRELGKFARRHRVFVATAIGVVVALLLGLASTLRFAFGEAAERRVAQENARTARWNLYRSTLRAAAGAIADGEVGFAELELEQAPEEFRSWAWRLLASRLDSSIGSWATGREVPMVRYFARPLFFDPDGRFLFLHDEASDTCAAWDLSTGERSELRIEGPSAVDPRGMRSIQVDADALVLRTFPDGEPLASVPLPPELGTARWKGLSFAGEECIVLRTGTGTWSIACQDGQLGARFEEYEGERAMSTDAAHRWVALGSGAFGRPSVRDRELGATWPLLAADDADDRWLSIDVSRDGARLAGVSQTGRMASWTLTGSEGPTIAWRVAARSKGAQVVAISPDGALVAAAGASLDVLDANTGEWLFTLAGHRTPVRSVAFSTDGSRLASVDREGDVRLWRLDGDPNVLRLGDFVYVAEFDPPGARICVGTADGELVAFDARSSVEIGRRRLFDGAVTSVCFDSVGSWCAVTGVVRGPSGLQHETCVLDAATGEQLWTRRHEKWDERLAAAFTLDGQSLVLVGTRGYVAVCDAATGDVRIEGVPVQRGRGTVPALAIDGSTGEILCGADGALDVYDPATLAHSERFANDGGLVTGVALSADGELLAAGSADHAIRVWELRTGELVAELRGHVERVFSVCWSADGSRLFSGSRDATVKIWDTERWTDVAGLAEHGDYVFSVRTSPDGETLISCGGDGTVRIWRPRTRREQWFEELRYGEVAERVAPLVDELLAASGPSAAAEALRGRDDLSAREHEVARHLLFARGLGVEGR